MSFSRILSKSPLSNDLLFFCFIFSIRSFTLRFTFSSNKGCLSTGHLGEKDLNKANVHNHE